MDNFVDLDRQFIRLSDYPDSDDDSILAQFDYGRLSWSALLQRPRVVLLAGARAGKSSELSQATARLRGELCKFYAEKMKQDFGFDYHMLDFREATGFESVFKDVRTLLDKHRKALFGD